MEILKQFKDGSAKLLIDGIEISVNKSGLITFMSDWGELQNFIELGIVKLDPSIGPWNHSDFNLTCWQQA